MTPRSLREAFGPTAKLYVHKEPSLLAQLVAAVLLGALTGLLIVLPSMI